MTAEEIDMSALGSPAVPDPEPRVDAGDRALLAGWSEEHRAEATARARRQARLLTELAAADADLRAVLGSACAEGAVSVWTQQGCTLSGLLAEVGADFVALRCRSASVVVRLASVAAVRGCRHGLPTPPVTDRTLGQVASRLVGSDVTVIGSGTSVQGELVGCGSDHLVLACGHDERVVMTLWGIDHLSVRASG
ncbi:MAG TPA: hypothetical protein VFP54_08480 [Acidimicrobiales bacterium]|nr:hypothetical protein [Acidimicrobiales bacterium]